MALEAYRKKRDFQRTNEPSGDGASDRERGAERLFVIQKHAASRLHYDIRLEHDGVLLSWAVPKGPSVDPDERRLAVRVEDHPLEYAEFEGVIPEGEYGGGTVLLWDRGGWTPEGDPGDGLQRGKLSFTLRGEKLHGRWTLVRMNGGADGDGDRNWLLIHSDDDPPLSSSSPEPVDARPESVATGRTLEEVAEDRDRIWSEGRDGSPGRTASPAANPPDPAGLDGARPGSLPERPKPELATRVAEPPEGDAWIHEVKFDGYRILAVHRGEEITLLTRGGNDWTSRFPRVAAALESLSVDESVLDGELVFLRSDGTTSFQELQRVLGDGGTNRRLCYYAFDLVHLDGYDLRGVRLLERKETLRDVLGSAGVLDDEGTDGAPGPIRYSDHIRGEGPGFLHQACRLALEGAMSKRASSRYREGRTRDWRKSKCVERQEFVVVGFTDPSGARGGFGSLVLGYHRPDGSLAHAGRVGTGFTAHALSDLADILRDLEREDPPFRRGEADGERDRSFHWVEPQMVVEVEFTEWTRDGVLRHPSFKGVREDVQPDEVRREMQAQTSDEKTERPGSGARSGEAGGGHGSDRKKTTEMEGVRLTHPDRVLYPEQGVTKRRLAEYYRDVGDRMLEHAAHRPLTLVRCPKGRGEECFYQKHANESVPDVVETVEIEESEGRGRYMVLDSVASLVALVQIGTLEIHLWGSRIDRLERPDRIVFDLDPGPGAGWSRVVDAARDLRERLDGMDLESLVKTTGGKGLHVEVPIVRRNGWDEVKAFARAIARRMASDEPERYVAKAAKAERRGRIYVDYLRNARGATAVSPYSSRARPGAPVAVPVRWNELGPGLDPSRYTVDTVLRRLAALGDDPWEEYGEVRQSITRPMRKSLGIEGSS